ncbi:hypothetical protein GARC_1647 [Paraglaciecola arctica BSs20135]|uniref:Uncharacterized protein n=1 Tax=Paraglaciecola arctica BSs20135 TaxID=493475 RepID=K6XD94_9ALTE|nr:hypothetical protein GARC_1647 [Paraglaciecola arctica BSs20135]
MSLVLADTSGVTTNMQSINKIDILYVIENGWPFIFTMCLCN